MAVEFRDNDRESRYEVLVDDVVAGVLTYKLHPDRIALIHTEVFEEYAGRGLATVIVTEALADARRRGLHVLPFCPLVRQFIADHPAELDLVAAKDRARFDLPPAEPEQQG